MRSDNMSHRIDPIAAAQRQQLDAFLDSECYLDPNQCTPLADLLLRLGDYAARPGVPTFCHHHFFAAVQRHDRLYVARSWYPPIATSAWPYVVHGVALLPRIESSARRDPKNLTDALGYANRQPPTAAEAALKDRMLGAAVAVTGLGLLLGLALLIIAFQPFFARP